MMAESPVMSACSCGIAHHEFGAAAIATIVGGDGAALDLDQALGDREPEAGTGATPIAAVGAIELVEQPVESRGRDARPFVAHDDLHSAFGRSPFDLDPAPGRRVLGGVVED